MKTGSKKKFYSWTAKQKRKKRSKHSSCYGYASVPKSYVIDYTRARRAKEREGLAKLRKGVKEEMIDFPFQHRHSAVWDYW